jgi:hypothetical protein
MSAYVVQIADAVVAKLNAAASAGILSEVFTAQRAEVVVSDLIDIDTLQVSVIPGSLVTAVWDLSRRLVFDWQVSVWVLQRVSSLPPNVDPLRLLIEQIITLFLGQQLGLLATTSRCIGAETVQLPDPEKLDVMSECKIGIFFTFRVTQ